MGRLEEQISMAISRGERDEVYEWLDKKIKGLQELLNLGVVEAVPVIERLKKLWSGK